MNALPEDALGADDLTAGRAYHAKRPHKKSRAGCHNCKTRKVKCNEERPRCRACMLRKETCVYPPAAPSSSVGSTASPRSARAKAAAEAASSAATAAATFIVPAYSSPPSSSSDDGSIVHFAGYSRSASPGFSPLADDSFVAGWSSQSAGSKPRSVQGHDGFSVENDSFRLLEEPLFLPMDYDQTDMKLLWFYTAKGYDAFAAEAGHQPGVDEVMQVTIPRHAFASRFLMDCLLALSALELQMLDQPIEPSRVLMYRARAFAGYRRAVEGATPETYPALLACSLLLCALSSQMFRDVESTPLYILDWMVVWRGISLIVKLIQPGMLFKSGMSMLFARPPIDLDASAKYIPNQMLFMVSSIRQDDPDSIHSDIYYETLKYLGSLYRELQSGISRILNVRAITWLTFLSKGFMDLARERRPRALIILAHYLVFVKMCNRLWWMRGIANKEIKDIRNVLEEEWHSFLSTPLAALETENEVEIGKILLNNSTWQPGIYDSTIGSQSKKLTLVDNSGQIIIYNGAWVQADTGKLAIWNTEEPLDMSSAEFKPDGIIGLRGLSLEPPEGSSSPEDTTNDDVYKSKAFY